MRLLCLSVLLLLTGATGAQAPARSSSSAATASKPPLTAEWKAFPTLTGNAVKGSIVVSNQSDDSFDQTVIVEAVNDTGKAFALGYQHFTLPRHSTSALISFSTTLPPGHYIVHADAVAEVASNRAIYRVHLQAPKALVVSTI